MSMATDDTNPQVSQSLDLVTETAIETGDTDLILTAEEYEELDQHFKRRLAGAANTDEITGKSTLLEIRSFVVRQRTLGEYAQD